VQENLVQVQAGTCDSDALGGVIAELTSPSFATGQVVGPEGAVAAETSFSTIAFSLDQLLASPHAITLQPAGQEATQPIACGEVGGVLSTQPSLAIVLSEQDASGFNGIAFLAPNGDNPSLTDVSLFIAGGSPSETTSKPIESTTSNPVNSQESTEGASTGENSQEFLSTLRNEFNSLSASTNTAVALFQNPTSAGGDFRAKVLNEATYWQIAYREAQAMVPPPEYQAIYDSYLEFASMLNDAAVLLNSSVVRQSQDELTLGVALVVKASELIPGIETQLQAVGT
jgi:hypothetical protein